MTKSSKLQSIGALAGGLAHDFNNMLTAVLGNLSLLRYRGNLPADTMVNIVEAERGGLARAIGHARRSPSRNCSARSRRM